MSFNDRNRWELLTSLMSDGFYVLQDYKYVFVNSAYEKILGASPGQLLGKRFEQFIHPDMRSTVVSRYEERLKGHPAPKHYEISLLDIGGNKTIEAWLEDETFRDENQQIAVAGMVRDIGSLNSLKNELASAQKRLQTIMDNMSDTIYQTSLDGKITLMSNGVESLLGYKPEEIMGTELANYYWSPEEREKVVNAITKNNGAVTNVEAILKRKDGTPVWISTNAYIKKNQHGEPTSVEGVARDVTVQKELEQKLEKLALTDSLTSLPNRRALMDELHLRYCEAKENDSDLTLIYLDVNEFKNVNDSHGHLTGDSLLIHTANLLRSYVSGVRMFGRLSGDEFLYILPGYSVDEAQKLASQIFNDIKKKPLFFQQNEIAFSLAIGLSSLKAGDKNEYSLLDRADKAMFLAKRGVQAFEIL